MRCETLPLASCDKRIIALHSKPKIIQGYVYRTEQFCLETSIYEYKNTYGETIPRLLLGFHSLRLGPTETLVKPSISFEEAYRRTANEPQDLKFGIGLYDFQKEKALPAVLEYYTHGFFAHYDDFVFFEVNRNPEMSCLYIIVNAKPNCYVIIDDPEKALVNSFRTYQAETPLSVERVDYLLSLHNRLSDRERLLSGKIWLKDTKNPDADPFVFEFYLDLIYEESGPVMYLGTECLDQDFSKHFEVCIHDRFIKDITYRIENAGTKPRRCGTYQTIRLTSNTIRHVDVLGLSLENLKELILLDKRGLCRKILNAFECQLRELGFETQQTEIL
ncbi:MAG: hypothetical protein KatS3mg083_630 [Candidatus Dojkabacteria bacterium]|nr:MAG: hypothetical protein KatS3mg083_630 [Candidatus Dojkabacteria bacterium]